MDVTKLLDRLHKVKANGPNKWLACCPAHEDKHPSLAIRVTEDGRVLIHCFTGCGAAEVISAAGLEFGDLFPERADTEHFKPRIPQPFTAADALRCLASESGVIAIACADLAQGAPLNAADAQRVELAAGRLQSALEYVYGHR